MSETDSELLSRVSRGDEDALNNLLERFAPSVRQAIVGKIPKHCQTMLEVDDVLQVTYMEAFLHLGRFEPMGAAAFLGWLRRIAENNLRDAIDALNAEKRPQPRDRVKATAGQDTFVALYELLGATTTTPSRIASQREIHEALEAVIDKLPAVYAKVVRMYDLEEQPVSVVAEALGRSGGAVYMLRARAIDRLREELPSVSRLLG